MNTTHPKKGDRQRTPRSPFGLPQKRPRPAPSPPSKIEATVGDRMESLLARSLWKLTFRSLPLSLPLVLLLLKLRNLR
jgi:hypothetical protein